MTVKKVYETSSADGLIFVKVFRDYDCQVFKIKLYRAISCKLVMIADTEESEKKDAINTANAMLSDQVKIDRIAQEKSAVYISDIFRIYGL
jgi:hypothetical protein